MFVSRGVVDAGRLGVAADAAAKEAGGEDAGVVEDDEFIAAQQVGKFAELAVLPRAGPFVEEQHAGSVARAQRMLRDAFGRQVEI